MKKMLRVEAKVALLTVLCCAWISATTLLAENAVNIGSASTDAGGMVSVPLSVSGDADIEGFVLAFDWSSGSDGLGVDLDTSGASVLANAELVRMRVGDNFMMLGVVVDTDGSGTNVIPAGDETPVGVAVIRCPNGVSGEVTTPIRLRDGTYAFVDGGPTVNNIIVSNQQTIDATNGLTLRDGSFTCRGEVAPGAEKVFACGGELDANGDPGRVTGQLGSSPTVHFYYKSDSAVQGLSMSVTYDCDLSADPATFDTSGGALDAASADFVNIDIDNNLRSQDGDSCEFIVGVLVDAADPFDGRMLPATGAFQRLFSLDFEISIDALCDTCLQIRFQDGLDGNGTPPTKNLISTNFASEKPDFLNCEVCVEGEKEFIRGDCNFSGEFVMGVDIADAAAMVGFFFLQGASRFDAPCEDACDANDDGRLDVADVVYILEYMFIPNMPAPPAPGPELPGVDPTPDSLGCDGAPSICVPPAL